MHKYIKKLLFALFFIIPLQAYTMEKPEPPPRFQALKTFEPHRSEFTCKYEADAVPPLDAEAETWNQEALYVTRFSLWPNEKNWKKAENLWRNAAARNHWKAMMNLASLYERGRGEGDFKVLSNPYKAVEIAEDAMTLGIPAGYDKMGDYHMKGLGGIRPDGSRAWALWQMAADMGNPTSQTQIGKSISGVYDNPQEGIWGNKVIGRKMLECALSQANDNGAFELGLELGASISNTPSENARALLAMHAAVIFGSETAASYLFASFDDGDQITKNIMDKERADRYKNLGKALFHNPDLRFPNLDKILPLPPAKLPDWDGKVESLIAAAQPIRAVNNRPVSPASLNFGREYIPDSLKLDHQIYVNQKDRSRFEASREMIHTDEAPVPYSGYWQQKLKARDGSDISPKTNIPAHYVEGENFPPYQPPARATFTVEWIYLGVGTATPHSEPLASPPRLNIRTVPRAANATSPMVNAGKACPTSGIWFPEPVENHPQAKLIDPYLHQRYIKAGTTMPDATAWGLPTEGKIIWRLLEAAK